MSATSGDIKVKPVKASPPSAAEKVVARVSLLAFQSFRDHVATVKDDLVRLAPAVLYVVRACVNSKHLPSAEEGDVAGRIVADLLRLCGVATDDAFDARLKELITEFRDQIRFGVQAWKPRG